MKKIVYLLVFSCLTGCVQIPTIQDAPEGVPRAKLRVIASAGSNIWRVSKGQNGEVVVVGRMNLNGRSLGISNPERINGRPFAEFYVEAGDAFDLFYNAENRNSLNRCIVSRSFMPEEGKNYEVQAQWLQRIGICLMDVSVFENGQWTPVFISKQR